MATEFPVSANTGPAIAQINRMIDALRRAGKEAGKTDEEIEEMIRDLKRAGNEGQKNVNELNKSFKNLVDDGIKKAGAALVAMLAVDKMREFIGAVVRITSEFQKFEAVLTNALGSRSQARIALNELVDIAAKTPFSVQQLTASYIKLVNQGFKPTREEIIKLGDLSAAVGKDFDQLTEAIIDAQTGEFERLKEFGIRAAKEGDRVTFTFKGVKTQVDFTAESIRNYVLSLGEAEGVSGSMAAISETLGGQISNLEDNWDRFLETVGDGNKGILKDTISLLSRALEVARELVMTDEQRLEQLISEKQREAIELFKLYVKGYEDIEMARKAFLADNEAQMDALDEEFQSLNKANQETKSWRQSISELVDSMHGIESQSEKDKKSREDRMQAISDEVDALYSVKEAIDEYIKSLEDVPDVTSTERPLGLVERIEKEIKELQVAAKQATSPEQVEFLNSKIQELVSKLKQLKKAGQEISIFDDSVLAEFSKQVAQEAEKDVEQSMKRGERWMKAFTDKYKEELDKRLDATRNHEEMVREIREGAFNAAVGFVDQLFQAELTRTSDRLAFVQAQREQELQNAGDNEEARAKIEESFARKERQLRRQQANQEKAMTLYQIFINTASAVVEALPNVVLAGIVGAAGVAQAALVSSRPVPAFKDGVYDLQGPGTETSDSILARVSRGEDIVPSRRNKKFGFLLKPIIENEHLSLFDVRRLIDEKLPTEYNTVKVNQVSGVDSPELLEEMRATRMAVSNLKQVNLSVDENGFHVFTRKSAQRTTYVNGRFRV